MDLKSKGQMRADPNRYVSQTKSTAIYEPVLRSKDERGQKASNGSSVANNLKTTQNNALRPQEEIDAYELAQAQKSLRLLKAKMSTTPKPVYDPPQNTDSRGEPKTFQKFPPNKFSQHSEPIMENNNNAPIEEAGGQNKNYRKVFKPSLGNEKKEESNQSLGYQGAGNPKKSEEPNYIKMTKNTTTSNSGSAMRNDDMKATSPISQPSYPKTLERKISDKKSPYEDVQKFDEKPGSKAQSKPMENTLGASRKPLNSKNSNMKPTAEDYEYYDKNTRHYSNYTYQENLTEPVQDVRNTQQRPPAQKPANPTQISASSKPGYGNAVQPKSTTSYDKAKYQQPESEEDDGNGGEDHDDDEQEPSENDDDQGNEDEDDRKIGGAENPDEYGEAGELVKCTMGCGRKFNVNSIKKHMKICKKVFQAKRKVFDSSKARTDGLVEEKVSMKGKSKPAASQNTKSAGNKKNLWKKQSEAFRTMLKQTRGQEVSQQEEKNLQTAFEEAQDLVPCNFCGRKFNDAAAKKHIPFCENKHRMDKMKQQPGKKR